MWKQNKSISVVVNILLRLPTVRWLILGLILGELKCNTVGHLHAVVDENFVHDFLYLVKVWSLIRVLHPALFHKFPDLLNASDQLCNRWTKWRELTIFHSVCNVYSRKKDVRLEKSTSLPQKQQLTEGIQNIGHTIVKRTCLQIWIGPLWLIRIHPHKMMIELSRKRNVKKQEKNTNGQNSD